MMSDAWAHASAAGRDPGRGPRPGPAAGFGPGPAGPDRPQEPDEPDGPWQCATLFVAAALDSLGAIADYVGFLAHRGGVGPDAGLRLRLAVEELVANTVVHGYGGDPGWLVITGGGDGRGDVTVRLRDSARPFDPAAGRPAVALDLPVGRRPVGGLGIHLALTSADDYHYEHVHGENRSTLTVRRREGES
ncbi:MAG TPA: ATP-binding protein [Actinocrinis sp.]|nr:ATP-binding protein [Actinocrinis sp.]